MHGTHRGLGTLFLPFRIIIIVLACRATRISSYFLIFRTHKVANFFRYFVFHLTALSFIWWFEGFPSWVFINGDSQMNVVGISSSTWRIKSLAPIQWIGEFVGQKSITCSSYRFVLIIIVFIVLIAQVVSGTRMRTGAELKIMFKWIMRNLIACQTHWRQVSLRFIVANNSGDRNAQV